MENEGDKKEFFIRGINCGKFIRFEVPTKGDVSERVLTIHWKPTRQKVMYVFRKEKKQLIKNYADMGWMDGIFTPEEIEAAKQGQRPKVKGAGFPEPMSWEFYYFIPTNMGGWPHAKNVRLINSKTYYDVRHELLRPLEIRMRAAAKKFDYCIFQMPMPPKVVTDSWYRNFYEQNKLAEKETRKKWEICSHKTTITEISSGKCVVLKLTQHPFVHCPTRLVHVSVADPDAREAFRQDDQLHHRLYRRDALALKGIGKTEQAHMVRRFELPQRMKLEMHHILSLALGGKNELDNLMFVPTDVHKMFNATIEKPLKSFIEAHGGYPQKDVYIEMPMPMTAYKEKELPIKIQTRKQLSAVAKKAERRKLRRQMKCDIHVMDIDYERED